MMTLVTFDYQIQERLRKLPREDWHTLREAVPTLGLGEWPEDQDKPPDWYRYHQEIAIWAPTDMPMLAKFGIKYNVERIKNTMAVAHNDGAGNITNLNFALPNIGLLSISEVTWLDDACTEEVQHKLEDGWRIIAVCPPNGARRPDYIFGRTKPE
jgi:hypothetical protein